MRPLPEKENCVRYVMKGESAGTLFIRHFNNSLHTHGYILTNGKTSNPGAEQLPNLSKVFKQTLFGDDQICKYGKIIILTDGDVDGHHITALIFRFLTKDAKLYFAENRVYKLCSPLFVYKSPDNQNKRYFHSKHEFAQ